MNLRKANLEGKIVEVEKKAALSGVPSYEIWKRIYDATGKEVFLDFYERLRRGDTKSSVYGPYLSPPVRKTFEEIERKALPPSEILGVLEELLGESGYLSSIIKTFTFQPLALYFLASLVLSLAINYFFDKISFARELVSDPSAYDRLVFLSKIFPFVAFGVFFLMLFAFFKFPDRIPFLRNLYVQLHLLRVLGFTKVFYSAGISLREIVRFFVSEGSLPGKLMMESGRDDEGAISYFVSKVVGPEEGVILEYGIRTGTFEDSLEKLYSAFIRELRFRSQREATKLNYLSYVLVLIPVGIFAFLYLSAIALIISGVMEMLSEV